MIEIRDQTHVTLFIFLTAIPCAKVNIINDGFCDVGTV